MRKEYIARAVVTYDPREVLQEVNYYFPLKQTEPNTEEGRKMRELSLALQAETLPSVLEGMEKLAQLRGNFLVQANKLDAFVYNLLLVPERTLILKRNLPAVHAELDISPSIVHYLVGAPYPQYARVVEGTENLPKETRIRYESTPLPKPMPLDALTRVRMRSDL